MHIDAPVDKHAGRAVVFHDRVARKAPEAVRFASCRLSFPGDARMVIRFGTDRGGSGRRAGKERPRIDRDGGSAGELLQFFHPVRWSSAVAKLIALYRHPADPAAFDDYYFSKHVPLAKRMAGLRRYEVSRGGVGALQGGAPYHLAAILSFDSVAAMQGALTTPEGQATAADLVNFADAGVELLIFDTEEI